MFRAETKGCMIDECFLKEESLPRNYSDKAIKTPTLLTRSLLNPTVNSFLGRFR